MRTAFGLGLALVSAALMVVIQPEWGGLWPLAFVAVVPAIVAAYRYMPRRLSGLPLGIAWFGYWLAWGVLSRQIAPLWLLTLAAFAFGVIGVLVASFDRRLAERTNYRWFLLQLPVTWTAVDVLTGWTLLKGREGELASVVAPAPVLIQPVSVVGAYGLTFWIVLVNCTLALAVLAWLDRRSAPADSVPVRGSDLRAVGATGAIVSLLWVGSSLLIYRQVRESMGPVVRVAAIQFGPGDGYDAAGDGAETPRLLQRLADGVRAAKAQGAQLAVLGEHLVTFDPRTDPNRLIPDLARETGMYVQIGWSVGELPTATNVTGLWAPDGSFVGEYFKINPVILDNEDFVQPVRYPVFDTAIGPIGLIICFDFSFEAPTRAMVSGGAQLMSAAVGDWSIFAPMRIPTVALRAAENRVPFVKAEIINASAIVDGTGTVVAEATARPDGGPAVLVADVPLGPAGAPYTFLGPVLGYLAVVALVVRIIAQARCRSRDATPSVVPPR